MSDSGEPPDVSAFRCPKCGRSYGTKQALVQHLAFSSSCGSRAKAFVCPRCSAAFGHAYQLAEHVRAPKACALRQRRRELDALLQTARREQETEPTLTPTDDSTEATVNSDATTMPLPVAQDGNSPKSASDAAAEEGAGKSLSCPKCERVLGTEAGLRDHADYSKSCGRWKDRFACTQCGATFPRLPALARHAESTNACDVVRRRSETLQAIGLAQNAVGSDEEEPEVAREEPEVVWKNEDRPATPVTDSDEQKPEGRAAGRRLDVAEGTLTCHKCGAGYAKRQKLIEHLDHSKSCGERPRSFRCQRCAAAYTRPSLLANHLRSEAACRIRQGQNKLKAMLLEAAAKQGEVKDVGKSSAGPSGVGEKVASSCPKCGADMKHPHRLLQHLRSRGACDARLRRAELQAALDGPVAETPAVGKALSEAERQLRTCPKCGRSFKERNNLLVHMSVSRSCGYRARAHQCVRCGSAFGQASQLRTHLNRPKACAVALRRKRIEETIQAAAKLDSSSASDNSEVKTASSSVPGKAETSECPKCGAVFRARHDLANHLKSESACAARQRRAELQAALDGPVTKGRALSRQERELLNCPKCGRRYANRGVLLQHMAHSVSCGDTANKFVCDKCAKAFSHAFKLALHKASGKACQANIRRRELEQLLRTAAEGTGKVEERHQEASDTPPPTTKGEAAGTEVPASHEAMQLETADKSSASNALQDKMQPSEAATQCDEKPPEQEDGCKAVARQEAETVCRKCGESFTSVIRFRIHQRRRRACR